MLEDDVLIFVRKSIRSTWALELLLLMRQQREHAAAAAELVRALRGSKTVVATCLDQLRNAGLIARNDAGLWQYAPAAPALDLLAEKLERAYRERPVAVISAIVGSPDDRLRSFADAFRFPKKDD